VAFFLVIYLKDGQAMNDPEVLKEAANAVQEVAKTSSKVVDAAQTFGSFVARFIGGPLEQGSGIVEDNLKYRRWENQLKLRVKAEKHLKSIGLSVPTRLMPLKIGIPFFQAASLEEDDSLQDLWAALLVNGANAESGIEIKRAYIQVLESISPLDARILLAIYTSPTFEHAAYDGFWTRGLPDEAIPAPTLSTEGRQDQISEEIKLSLISLNQLDCVRTEEAFYGGQLFFKVHRTAFGQFFFDACTLKVDRTAL
jgi:hypothetical protein